METFGRAPAAPSALALSLPEAGLPPARGTVETRCFLPGRCRAALAPESSTRSSAVCPFVLLPQQHSGPGAVHASPCCSFLGRWSLCIRPAPSQGASVPTELQQPECFLGLRNLKRWFQTRTSAPSPGPGEPLTHHHGGWRAALEDGAVSALPGPGETRSRSSGMERKDLCAAHTNVASGSSCSSPCPGSPRTGMPQPAPVSPELPWADLLQRRRSRRPSLPCLLSCRSPLVPPASLPLPRSALTGARVLVAWGPWPASLASRSWWWGSQDPCAVAELSRDLGCSWERPGSCPSSRRCLRCLKLPVSPPFQSPCRGTLPLGRAVLSKRPRGVRVLWKSPATERVLPRG